MFTLKGHGFHHQSCTISCMHADAFVLYKCFVPCRMAHECFQKEAVCIASLLPPFDAALSLHPSLFITFLTIQKGILVSPFI